MIAAMVVLSLLCFAASMIGYATGSIADPVTGFWSIVIMLPLFALPTAMVLIIVLLVVTGMRRAKENRS